MGEPVPVEKGAVGERVGAGEGVMVEDGEELKTCEGVESGEKEGEVDKLDEPELQMGCVYA